MEAEFCYVVSGQFNFKLGERIVSAAAEASSPPTQIVYDTPPVARAIVRTSETEPGLG
jgi:hypothetical protein